MKNIYNSPLPEAATTNERDRLAQKLAQAGLLGQDGAAVEGVSSEAADLRLEGQYRWGKKFSTMISGELDELANSSLPVLPLFRPGGDYENAGYYEIADADVEPLHANRRDAYQYTLSLTHVGTRASHFRAVRTTPSQVDHDEQWGNDQAEHVGVPASASKVQWVDEESAEKKPATSVDSCATSFADVDEYDLDDGRDALGLADDVGPTLIYKVSYQDDSRAATRVYDTRGNSDKFDDGGDGPRQWQTVHSTSHDTDDPLVVSNGCLRLELDEPNQTIAAEAWDSDGESWASIELTNDSDWSLFDVDVTAIGMVRAEAQLTFTDGTELFALDAIVERGGDAVLFDNPQAGEPDPDPIPQELLDWLAPVAASTVFDTGSSKGLVERSGVRK